MVATTIPTPLVTSDIDGSTQIGNGVKALTDAANLKFGLGRRITVGFAGDSIADNNGGGKFNNVNKGVMAADSAPFWMMAEHFNADVDFNNKRYEDGGYGFALGGSTTEHFKDVQVPQILDRPPDILVVCPLQNDDISDAASAMTSAQRVIDGVTTVLPKLPVGAAIQGILPKGILQGSNVPEAREMANLILRAWAERTPGVVFMDVLSTIRDTSGEPESRGATATVLYKPAYTYDQVHFLPDGARAIAHIWADAFRRLVRERQLHDIMPRPYDPRFFWNAYFGGRRGLMLGTGGGFNGASSSAVAADWGIDYPTDRGITFTPSLAVGPDGFIYQYMTPTGTATSDVIARMRATSNQATGDINNPEVGMFGSQMVSHSIDAEDWGVSYSDPICSVGADSWKVSGAYTGKRLFRSPRLVPFSNNYNEKEVLISFVVPAGSTPKGSIGVSCVGMMRQGNV